MKKELQIELSYGNLGKSWLYVDIEDTDTQQQMEDIVIRECWLAYESSSKFDRCSIGTGSTIPRPTVRVKEVVSKINGTFTVRGGIKFSVRWT